MKDINYKTIKVYPEDHQKLRQLSVDYNMPINLLVNMLLAQHMKLQPGRPINYTKEMK